MKCKVQSAKLGRRNGKFFAFRFSLFASPAFTLVELLVVIAIMTIVTSIAVFNNSQFNSSVILSNLAYEIALSVREAQSYGIDVKSSASCNSGDSSSCFTSGYGVDFNMSNPENYILFQDTIPDHSYETGELLQSFSIGKGFSIKKLQYFSNNTNTWTSVSGPLDISFLRPNPDAYIYINGVQNQSEVEICIQDPSDTSTRAIQVEPTGQISVVASCDN